MSALAPSRAHTHRSLTPFDHTITTCRCYLMLHNSYVFLRINRVKMVQLSHSFKPVVCVNKIRNKWFFCAATQITSRFGMVGHNHRIHYTLWIIWMGYRILFCVFVVVVVFVSNMIDHKFDYAYECLQIKPIIKVFWRSNGVMGHLKYKLFRDTWWNRCVKSTWYFHLSPFYEQNKKLIRAACV